MGEFKFLRRLLFFHGRINYARVSETIIYFFYKNFVFTINHFYFVFLSLASGQTLIDDWFISLYNLIFTAFPLGVRACADQDLRDEDGEVVKTLTPFMYLENRESPLFNIPQFGLGLLRGIIHGLLNFLIVYFSLLETIVDIEGNTADLWFMSVDIYTAIILVKFSNNIDRID
jgi:magnesium-transporting ATPase (P-type)